jgi:hypothetical protein
MWDVLNVAYDLLYGIFTFILFVVFVLYTARL